MLTAFDQVRSLIPSLSKIDRKKALMLLERFGGSDKGASSSRSESLQADWLLQGILKELGRRGQPSFNGGVVKLRGIAPNYELASQDIRAYYEGAILRPTPTELNALGVVLGRSLAKYISSWQKSIPIALRPMLLNIERVPEALENSFPNYVAGGMLPMLVGRR